MDLAKLTLKDLGKEVSRKGSRLLDYKTYPSTGQSFMVAEQHPLYEFFHQKFSCNEYIYLESPWTVTRPKNLTSINLVSLKKEFLENLKGSLHSEEWVKFTRPVKAELAQIFLSYILLINDSRAKDPHDNGLNLSRGSIGDFLRRTYWKLLVLESEMSLSDVEVVKKYFMPLTSDQRNLPPLNNKEVGPVDNSQFERGECELENHPLNDFFKSSFSFEQAARLLNRTSYAHKPKNYKTTYSSDYLREQILLELNKFEELDSLSPQGKGIIQSAYLSHIARENSHRMSLEDTGLGLSKGSLETFIATLYSHLLFEERNLSEQDVNIFKRYFIPQRKERRAA